MRATIALVGVCGFFFSATANAATLDDLLRKQEQLRKQAEQNKKALEVKRKEANSLQDVISDLSSDIATTQERITATERDIELTNQIIVGLNAEINRLDRNLRNAYVTLYELSRTARSSVVFSNSINEQLSHSQYVQAIQSQLQDELGKLDSSRAEQEEQKKSLESLNSDLAASKQQLTSRRGQQNYLLALNLDQQAEYEASIKKIQSEFAKVSDAVIRERERLLALENVNNSGTGGYPYASWSMNVPDPWGFLTRQCTSYAAWKWNVVYGKRWLRGEGPPGTGDAKNWATLLAPRNGYATGSNPQTGSIIVWPAGPGIGQYGHVAIVERVYGNGNIDVSEYNFSPPMGGKYSYRTNINPRAWGNPTYIYQ